MGLTPVEIGFMIFAAVVLVGGTHLFVRREARIDSTLRQGDNASSLEESPDSLVRTYRARSVQSAHQLFATGRA